jgi:hypothetical protein
VADSRDGADQKAMRRWAALMAQVGLRGHVFEVAARPTGTALGHGRETVGNAGGGRASPAPVAPLFARVKRDHHVPPAPQEVNAALTLRVEGHA